MELEVLGTRGIPASGILSVSAGGYRRQAQLSAIEKPLRFPGKAEDGSLIKVDLLDVVGRGRLPFESSVTKYTVPVNVGDVKHAAFGDSMEVDVVIRPCDSNRPTSPVDEDARRKNNAAKEVDASAYLEEHDLVTFVQFLLTSLMEGKPADPYLFIQQQVDMRMASRSGGTSTKSKARAPSLEPIASSILQLEKEVLEASERLRSDNARLRQAAAQLKREYENIIKGTALAPDTSSTEVETKTQTAFSDIDNLQAEVTELAHDNAKLVEELARGRDMIDLINKDMIELRQTIKESPDGIADVNQSGFDFELKPKPTSEGSAVEASAAYETEIEGLRADSREVLVKASVDGRFGAALAEADRSEAAPAAAPSAEEVCPQPPAANEVLPAAAETCPQPEAVDEAAPAAAEAEVVPSAAVEEVAPAPVPQA